MIHFHRSKANKGQCSEQCTLADMPVGAACLVRSLNGGKEVSVRLVALGITPGVQVTILQNMGHGPLTISVRDTRLALGRGEASRVLVESL